MSSPCKLCPYREDAPPGVWHADEFTALLAEDAKPGGGCVYNCHLRDGTVCRGWLFDQRRRGMPSVALRVALASDPQMRDVFDALDSPVKVMTIQEMVAANAGAPFPSASPAAEALARAARFVVISVVAGSRALNAFAQSMGVREPGKRFAPLSVAEFVLKKASISDAEIVTRIVEGARRGAGDVYLLAVWVGSASWRDPECSVLSDGAKWCLAVDFLRAAGFPGLLIQSAEVST